MAMLRKSRKDKPRAAGATIIASGCRLVGDLNVEGTLHVDGTLEGAIVTAGDVSIGHSGYVEGTIAAERLLVSGEIRGRVDCATLEIVASGKVYGEVASEGFVIEPGGQFVGESVARGTVRAALEQEQAESNHSASALAPATEESKPTATETEPAATSSR
ncbi:bactofilin family protein [Alkalilimnicola sp. S0819]|uniref:bactofilin family protein n=1 Tax=Alkalilimnicola sp. S0819 TaxID=2613922 RepID=UPI0012622FDB|nr:polymer-forming cytoskeletal protein [Alkalilimnicola sp. S0819]KAB7623696.1 polymer-forming cytoskeletal protein [Alkalilimnicola sp. S0819]MPQ16825.1 polymer-forming cytoskeletal family protein [Alkalilimnicola sp. S0819]